MMAEAGADLFNRTCFNYPTLGDLYKYATYAAMLKRDRLVVDDSGQLPTPPVS
jgi:NAD(P) transhydrogenase